MEMCRGLTVITRSTIQYIVKAKTSKRQRKGKVTKEKLLKLADV